MELKMTQSVMSCIHSSNLFNEIFEKERTRPCDQTIREDIGILPNRIIAEINN